ncbi:glycosyltransferase family 4 protein [Alkalihalobacterium alkalinitrilicum]|uniref:glycosyltransferase family 4 protein n=1 Tax=Alkalihalobacterium alkalinitrilicum TaxID=427920 RepID=UPI00099496B8|nr:glycosyltransferase family 4 protein [Alkalihalobacterium alkalinitrilicum]
MAKIVFIAPYAKFYINFRWELLETLVQEGHEVIAIGPKEGCYTELNSIGVYYKEIPLRNTGINPVIDIFTIIQMIRTLKDIKPDVLTCLAIKPVLYGSIVARILRITNVNLTITGLGYAFTGTNFKRKVLFPLIRVLYKLALSRSKVIFFENNDDLSVFKQLKLVGNSSKSIVINGSGVNVDKFYHKTNYEGKLVFLLVARLLKDKGIEEFVEATRKLKRKYPSVICKILGPFDENPTAISIEKISLWIKDGIIEYLGETNDVRPYLLVSSVFVLPSYREGTSKATLEAMAMGLPIITTNAPGCKETVKHKENGFIVPIKDAEALGNAMEKFILYPNLVREMGIKSRELAVEKYDVRKVNAVIKKNMGLR